MGRFLAGKKTSFLPWQMTVGAKTAEMGWSENSIPLHPVAHDFPYWDCFLGIYPHFQTQMVQNLLARRMEKTV
jgi:hypothetical protein